MAGKPVDSVKRFLKNFKKEPECWVWTGAKTSKGYGNFWDGANNISAHRFAFKLFGGNLKPGLILDHVCDNRSCVNPKHLKQTTHRENILRGTSGSAKNHRKRNCMNGHPLSGPNLYVNPNEERQCRICVYARNRRRYHAQKLLKKTPEEIKK